MAATEIDVQNRFLRSLVLCASVALLAARSFSFPTVGLDPSWKTGLLMARVNGLKWGTSLDYTYGPWGWLSVDTVIDRKLLILSIAFMIGVSALLVVAAWRLLRKAYSEHVSQLILLLIIVPVFSQVGIPDVLLAGVFGSLLVMVDRAQEDRCESWRSILPISFVVALSLQVKFSVGLFSIIGFLLLSLVWWRSRKSILIAWGSLVAWFLVLWLISEHTFGGLFDWARRSVAIGGAYAEVQSLSLGQPILLVMYVVFAIATVILLVHRHRACSSTRTVTIVSSLLVLFMLYAGLKTGFVREGNAHAFEAFALLIPAWIWLAAPIRVTVRRLVLLAVPAIVGISILVGERPAVGSFSSLYNWPEKASVWIDDANLLTSTVVFERKADAARGAAQAFYGLNDDMVRWLRESPAQVDPFDASLIWAYGLPWRPMPIFQTYMNFTPFLDGVTTTALADRAVDDTILIDTSWVGNLDYRLSLWTSPRYQLALTCSWIPIHRDGRWEQWAKNPSGDRCGSPQPIGTENVAANQIVTIPASGPDSFIIATFTRSSAVPSVVAGAINLLYKPLDPFTIRLGEQEIRQPRTFDGSPLIVSCPSGLPVTRRYEAVCPSPLAISFSESGTVTFERIPTRSS